MAKVAIWVCGHRSIEGTYRNMGNGFTLAKIAGIYIYSCYAALSLTRWVYIVNRSEIQNLKIITGDFNIWDEEWNSRETNTRAREAEPDPWSHVSKTVMASIKGKRWTSVICPKSQDEIINVLFPQNIKDDIRSVQISFDEIPETSYEEVLEVAKWTKVSRFPV